jgi:hypothetical protein
MGNANILIWTRFLICMADYQKAYFDYKNFIIRPMCCVSLSYKDRVGQLPHGFLCKFIQ